MCVDSKFQLRVRVQAIDSEPVVRYSNSPIPPNASAVAGRSADATKKALLRARNLEPRSERRCHYCGAARSPAATRCCRRTLCRSMHVARQRGSTIADHSSVSEHCMHWHRLAVAEHCMHWHRLGRAGHLVVVVGCVLPVVLSSGSGRSSVVVLFVKLSCFCASTCITSTSPEPLLARLKLSRPSLVASLEPRHLSGCLSGCLF